MSRAAWSHCRPRLLHKTGIAAFLVHTCMMLDAYYYMSSDRKIHLNTSGGHALSGYLMPSLHCVMGAF